MGWISTGNDFQWMLNMEIADTAIRNAVNSSECIAKGLDMLVHALGTRVFWHLTVTQNDFTWKDFCANVKAFLLWICVHASCRAFMRSGTNYRGGGITRSLGPVYLGVAWLCCCHQGSVHVSQVIQSSHTANGL